MNKDYSMFKTPQSIVEAHALITDLGRSTGASSVYLSDIINDNELDLPGGDHHALSALPHAHLNECPDIIGRELLDQNRVSHFIVSQCHQLKKKLSV